MASPETEKFNQLFDYLSAPERPAIPEAHGVLVFGRHDLRLVEGMRDLDSLGLASFFVISGGLGKDSGRLHDWNIPEAKFLAAVATAQPHPIPAERIYTDILAKNGGQNARFGLATMRTSGLRNSPITALAHATSLRRLAATLEHEGSKLEEPVEKVYRYGTNYRFDATNPEDQHEAAAEFMRLVEWPHKGWLQPQGDLPVDLIEFAAETVATLEP